MKTSFVVAVFIYTYAAIITSFVIDKRVEACGNFMPTIARVALSAVWPMSLPAAIFAPMCPKP